eukprot:PLAT12458.6.p2 GENE.PLAT12458.6~~PLAT12458.6.p2  ORF type:complete len:330 (+),score=123.68 PLAT12458.6:471-1460(+)
MAAAAGHVAVLQALLEAPFGRRPLELRAAQPNESALEVAARGGRVECVRELLHAGARNVTGRSPSAIRTAILAGQHSVLPLLFGMVADAVCCTDETGLSALALAAGADKPSCVATLLELGAKVNVGRPRDGSTPLHHAAAAGSRDSVSLLLDAAAAVDCVDSAGCLPLHRAAQSGCATCVLQLIEAGSPLWLASAPCELALAAASGCLPGLQALLRRHPPQERLQPALLAACSNDHRACAQALLQAGCSSRAALSHALRAASAGCMHLLWEDDVLQHRLTDKQLFAAGKALAMRDVYGGDGVLQTRFPDVSYSWFLGRRFVLPKTRDYW